MSPKQYLREICGIKGYVRKEWPQMDDTSFYFKKLEKEE